MVGEITDRIARQQLAGRTRFGITPPPLDSLPRDSLAISQPAFYVASADDELPRSIDDLLPRMLGTAVVDSGSKVGIFWESYGIVKGDSIDFAVNTGSKSA